MGYISWTHCCWRQYSVYLRMKRVVPFQNFRRRKVLITGCTFIFFFFIITIFINGKIWLNFKLLVLSWNPTLGTVPYDLYVGNICEMFWPSQFLSNTITHWSILSYIPWAHVLWLPSLCYWDVNKNVTTSFELQYSKTSWEMFQCFWHSLA